mgnify:CR=1 FL=1
MCINESTRSELAPPFHRDTLWKYDGSWHIYELCTDVLHQRSLVRKNGICPITLPFWHNWICEIEKIIFLKKCDDAEGEKYLSKRMNTDKEISREAHDQSYFTCRKPCNS